MSSKNQSDLRNMITGAIDEIESELESSIENLRTVEDYEDIEDIKAVIADELVNLAELKDKLY